MHLMELFRQLNNTIFSFELNINIEKLDSQIFLSFSYIMYTYIVIAYICWPYFFLTQY